MLAAEYLSFRHAERSPRQQVREKTVAKVLSLDPSAKPIDDCVCSSASRSSSCTTASCLSEKSLHDMSPRSAVLDAPDSPFVLKERFGTSNRRPSCVNLAYLDDIDGYATSVSAASSSRSAVSTTHLSEGSDEECSDFGYFVDAHSESECDAPSMVEILPPPPTLTCDGGAGSSPTRFFSPSVLHFEQCANGSSLHRTFHFGHASTSATLPSHSSSPRASRTSSSSSASSEASSCAASSGGPASMIHVVIAITASRCVKRSFLARATVEYELTITLNEREVKVWKSFDDFAQIHRLYTQYYTDKDYSTFSAFFSSSSSTKPSDAVMASGDRTSSSAASSPRRGGHGGTRSPACAARKTTWLGVDEDIDSLWSLVTNYYSKFPLLKSPRHVRKFGQYLEVFMRFILFESPHLSSLLFLLNIKDQVCLLVD